MGLFDFFRKEVKIEYGMNTVVFTTKNLMRGNLLITRIYHSTDSYLSFFDDFSTNSNENIMLVSLGEVLKKDISIKPILNMPIGHYAHRKNITDKWEIEKI